MARPLVSRRWLRVAALGVALAGAGLARAAEPSYCDEKPIPGEKNLSLGRPAQGKLVAAARLESTDAVRVLPLRHASRCLAWGTVRLISALHRAGEAVRAAIPGSPPLGVGDLSSARGGPIPPYSHSHQSGRDVDLAFYRTDERGQPVPADDLVGFDGDGRAWKGGYRFDVRRNWRLVRALLEDPQIRVEWMFISNPLRKALLAEAERDGAPAELRRRAEQVLHQPSDAPPHADHIHLRILCSDEERRAGCTG